MKNILVALDRLKAEPVVIRTMPLASPVEAQWECSRLLNTRNALRAASSDARVYAPPLNPHEVWEKFRAAGFAAEALNGLEFRTLCTSAETAIKPELIQAIRRTPERLRRSIYLYGLVNAYFTNWRNMTNPAAMENVICSACASFTRASFKRRNPVIEQWRKSEFLFSGRAEKSLAERIFDGTVDYQKSVEGVLKAHHVGPTTRLGRLAQASAARATVAHFRRSETVGGHESILRNDESIVQFLQWMTNKILTDTLMPDTLCSAVSSLILSKSAERSEVFRRALQAYVQTHPRLGDPRFRESAPNWRAMEPDATQRFLSWLARDSIIFFFNTILPDTDTNRRRKDFWLLYHSKIKDFQVALSEEDYWKVKASEEANGLAAYSRFNHRSTSAFMMRFGNMGAGILVVEFSETGNAAHILEWPDFKRELRADTYSFSDLKVGRERIIHRGEWEREARNLMARYGIRP
jgi:EH_Signature domain